MITPGSAEEEPGATEADESLAEWVADRLEAGDPVDVSSYTALHPERAERLRRIVRAMERIGRFRDPAPIGCFAHLGVLGDFRTIREIGRGGMGIVYEALQISLNRRVALKILPASSADNPRRVQRFQIEAQAAACLHHPHIVPVHGVGSERGVHFFAMQLIEGRTLSDEIGEGCPASPRSVAELGRQAADALHYAHEQGVIHRDIKPSNLLVDGSGHLWISDFGVARIGETGDLTLTGDVLGTPRYASPEQAIGAREIVDHRADIYSLGCTLYERLTLRPAFEADDRLELLRRIAEEDPKPLRRIDPRIPRDLEIIVLKAIAKDPADRYPTARIMADDLSRFLEDRPIHAQPPALIDHAAKWSRRHRSTLGAVAMLLLAVVIAAGVETSGRYRLLQRYNAELKTALDRAERNESSTRRLLYDSQVRGGHQALESGNAEVSQEILEGLKPKPGQADLRGFERISAVPRQGCFILGPTTRNRFQIPKFQIQKGTHFPHLLESWNLESVIHIPKNRESGE